MANLFNKNILMDTLKDFEIPNFEEKIAIIQQWHETYKSGTLQKMSEKEVEQSYNEEILGKVLGYTNFPANPFTRQPQPKTEVTGQKPDFGLGYYYQDQDKKDKTLAVIEVKDAKTDINKSQRREGNLSPIQQGFKYKPQYSDCRWVIVSNFFETKLFVDTQIDYEVWTLETLLDPSDNHFQFRKFYYLLCADNLISETGKSKTEDLLSAVRIQEEKITKAFYKEYKDLRLELIQDLIARNGKMISIPTLVEKAQKIIDRIVFIHFCEDTKEQLLPSGKLQEVVEYGEKAFAPIWQILCNFFEVVNSGSAKLGIPEGYNGGLFYEDVTINSLKVGDDICKKFVEIGKYDFSEDISVNILGHVFEQSISDLEDIKASLLEEKGSSRAEEMKQNKRKKDGIFYTPEYIVDYIVKNSLGSFLEEKFEEIAKEVGLKEDIQEAQYEKRLQTAYGRYQIILQNVTVLDPACGSGAFLVRVFDFLLEENKRVMDVLARGNTGMFDSYQIAKGILQNNIYGVDLNSESVEITKLSLWLKTAEKGQKLANLNKNIKCGNSLIDDAEVAGDKAFVWEEEFKEIMANGGFDVVVGNPPYVSTKSTSFIGNEKDYFGKKYKVAEYQTDTYPLFIEKGLYLISKFGKFGYVIPNSRLNNLKFSKLRKYLLNNSGIEEIAVMPSNAFEDATVDTVILILSKGNNKSEVKVSVTNDGNIEEKHLVDVNRFKTNDGFLFDIMTSNQCQRVLNKVRLGSPLESFGKISTGIKEYQVGKGTPKQTQQDKDGLVFNASFKKDETFKPQLRGKNLFRYGINRDGGFVSYGKRLAEPRDPYFFSGERILIRKIPGESHLVLCITDEEFIIDQSVYVAKIENEKQTHNLVGILNSLLMGFFFKYSAGEFDDVFPQIKVSHFRKLPIILPSDNKIERSVKRIIDANRQLYEKTNFVINFLQQKYNIEKPSKKLQHFRELDFKDFAKQLKIKKLGLEEEAELMAFFDKKKAEVLEIKEKIDATDKEIDEMVFDLYGLTAEEREIVMGG